MSSSYCGPPPGFDWIAVMSASPREICSTWKDPLKKLRVRGHTKGFSAEYLKRLCSMKALIPRIVIKRARRWMWTLGIEKRGGSTNRKQAKNVFCSIFIVIPPKKIKLGRSFHWGITTEAALHFQTDMWAPRGLENHVLLRSSREPKSGCISLAKWNAGSEWTTLIPL